MEFGQDFCLYANLDRLEQPPGLYPIAMRANLSLDSFLVD